MVGEIMGELEIPTSYTTVTRGMKIQGWAFSTDSENVDIEIHLDGFYIKDIQTGIPRYDIEKSHSEYKDVAYTSGFLTKILMPEISVYDYHTLEIIAKTKNMSKSIAKTKVKLNTEIIEKVWPDEGMTMQFRDSGNQTFFHLNRLCNLQPNFQVLDIGCQLGRLAIPLAKFLNKEGRYEGLDIIREAIDWCDDNISAKYPNFQFTWADVFNGYYNPKGKSPPDQYTLPYDDSSFDLVIAYSVFTHMLRKETEHYFSEISRVMKKGGNCWITFTILDDESLNQIQLKKTLADFKYEYDGYRSTDDKNPEASIAWNENVIRNICKKNNLRIIDPIYPGHWRGISLDNMLWQDIVIVTKE